MSGEQLAWAIFFLPLLSFAIISFFTYRYQRLSGYITVAAIGGAFALSLWVFSMVAGSPEHHLSAGDLNILTLGNLKLHLGIEVDSLTALMLIVVTSVSALVQIYSLGYMKKEEPGHEADYTDFPRYFAYMSLFTASMLGLVIADNLVMLYAFWELVGLSSYLLIGFWFQRPSAAAAAKKAFITTRLGDLGFLIAILIVYAHTGTFTISELFSSQTTEALARASFLGLSALTWVALGIFSGAMGKSAQFPLHVWLPDAMEGPTPVSALIHAATMVAAGVYLVGRMLPLFVHSTEAMSTVAIIGGFTAIFAASMGLVMNDIKRVLAYSTISQLGYMMLALGVGGYIGAFFHLMTHAFFKALLFLGSGSVNHTTGTFDMRYMGGLKGPMPMTFATFVVASLSLAGVPPLSGFWSKDEILLDVFLSGNYLLFALALIASFMTAFYIFRVIFMTFFGEYRGGAQAEMSAAGHHAADSDHDEHGSLHESPGVMVFPLLILGVLAVIAGAANLPTNHLLAGFLTTHTVEEALGHSEGASFLLWLAALSTVVSLLGILTAYLIYGAKSISAQSLGATFSGPYRILINKYGMDILYEDIIVKNILYRGVCGFLAAFDRYIVDGVVNGVAGLTGVTGSIVRKAETGQVQLYGLFISLGVVVITAIYMIRG